MYDTFIHTFIQGYMALDLWMYTTYPCSEAENLLSLSKF